MTDFAIGSCRIEIGTGLLDVLGDRIRASGGEKSLRCAVVTDANVAALHLEKTKRSFARAGIGTDEFILAPGEKSKTFPVYMQLLSFLAAWHFTRSDAILALGGGVVGDLAGFAASTFLRGMRFFQAPTTLLAMIDSGIGGKTAVDLPEGKNLCGTFYPAEKVFCDVSALATLPRDIFADGSAEAVKYGVIRDARLFGEIEDGALVSDAEKTIARCAAIKAEIVARDLYDQGERRLLNFGHTFGHAIEIASDFSFSHGRAVAVGMMEITRIAVRRKLCGSDVAVRLEKTLQKAGLPTENPYDRAALAEIMLNDKKRRGTTLEWVVPRAIGRAELFPVEIGNLKEFLS
ncbi:MAG: 3-dehydroquinate synthase [Victivallaceae bacterium]|nr:3-dehydroquinate synthase [Victivallaceae bacterium]